MSLERLSLLLANHSTSSRDGGARRGARPALSESAAMRIARSAVRDAMAARTTAPTASGLDIRQIAAGAPATHDRHVRIQPGETTFEVVVSAPENLHAPAARAKFRVRGSATVWRVGARHLPAKAAADEPSRSVLPIPGGALVRLIGTQAAIGQMLGVSLRITDAAPETMIALDVTIVSSRRGRARRGNTVVAAPARYRKGRIVESNSTFSGRRPASANTRETTHRPAGPAKPATGSGTGAATLRKHPSSIPAHRGDYKLVGKGRLRLS